MLSSREEGRLVHFGGFVGYSVIRISNEFSNGIISLLTIGKDNAQLEQTALPQSLFLAGNATLPNLQIKDSLSIPLRFRVEAKWMITSPLFSLLLKSVHTQRHCEIVATRR